MTLDEQLLTAASNNQKQNVIRLIKEGANVNARNQDNQTPLIIAAFNGYHSTVAALLKMPNIDLMAKDLRGCTALFYASEYPEVGLRILAHLTQEQINSELSTKYLYTSQMVGRYNKEITQLNENIFRAIFSISMWGSLTQWENEKTILIKTELCSVPRPKWCPKFLYVKQIHDSIDIIDKSLQALQEPKKTVTFLADKLQGITISRSVEGLPSASKESKKSRITARL
jgi:hypothetical protein